jgi:hypothetical protein
VLHRLLTIAVFCREHHLYLYYVAKRSKLRINPVNSQTDNWGPPNLHTVESNHLVLFPYRARDSTVRSLIFSQENPAPVPKRKRRGFIGGGQQRSHRRRQRRSHRRRLSCWPVMEEILPITPYFGDTKAARAEASMGGGEKATAAVPSPASSRQRITRFKPSASPSIAIPPPLVLHKPYLEK